MSPAMKSKSKSAAARAVREQVQASPKLPASAISGNGVPASGYNPVSGTFHTLESKSSGFLPAQNGRFRIIDKNEENSGSSSGTIDSDSLSNNGSCSGDSDDSKEKSVNSSACCTEPVSGVDADKHDKVRQKNGKKHQRQKERRAQELHERCSRYLMARKLETLSQQLVAMGFSFERATMAIMLNKGHLEESVSWLFDGGEASKEEAVATSVDSSNLKINISEEFARIVDMELTFKCTKHEVERAVVACEGDLDKAEEALKAQKRQSVPFSSLKTEQPATPATAISEFNHKQARHVSPSHSNSGVKAQCKGAALAISSIQQPKKDERDFNHFKAATVAAAAALGGTVAQDAANRSSQAAVPWQPLRRAQTKVTDWPSPLDASSSEKKWRPGGSTSQPFTYLMASPSFQDAVVLSDSSEARTATTAVGAEVKSNLPGRTLREPVIVMQRPQSAKQNNLTSASKGAVASPAAASTGWLSSSGGLSSMIDGKTTAAATHNLLPSLGLNSSSAQPFYPRGGNFQPFVQSNMVESGSWSTVIGASPSSLTAPSSLGLFTGWGSSSGSTASPLPVDWSTGSKVSHVDYKTIDWSLDVQHPSKIGRSTDSWSSQPLPWHQKASAAGHPLANGGGFTIGFPGTEDAGFLVESPSPVKPTEWTSPFAGRDLFILPRQFVASPSL